MMDEIQKELQTNSLSHILNKYVHQPEDLTNLFESLCNQLRNEQMIELLMFYVQNQIPVVTPSKGLTLKLFRAVMTWQDSSFSMKTQLLVGLNYKENKRKNQLGMLLNFIKIAIPDGKYTATLLKLLIKDTKNYQPLSRKTPCFQYIGIGYHKIAIYSSDYIISIGTDDQQKGIESHALYNETIFSYLNPKNGIKITVSPYQKVLKEDPNKEEILQSYFNQLCREGIIFFDITPKNMGRYLYDFEHPFKEASDLGKQFLGIEEVKMKPRKKGEVSIIDQDLILSKEDPMCSNIHKRFYEKNPWYHQCYDQYQKELKKVK